jgi:hypothetical protein
MKKLHKPSKTLPPLKRYLLFFICLLACYIPPYMTQAQINFGNLPAPTEQTLIRDLGSFGKIVRAKWTGNNKIGGTEQTLHMAELDFSKNTADFELKVVYVYNDPTTGQPIDPAKCQEFCYYIPCNGGPECQNGLQRFCEPVPGGQFDFISHLAGKYGAILATNGSFYDYFYNCVPGVKSFIKSDGQVRSFPNILNHRNEGAFAFDFSSSTTAPRMKIFKRQANTLEQLDGKDQTVLYGGDVATYPNIMSGGHIIENGNPYKLSTPSFCNGMVYPWSNDPTLTGANDILQKSGTVWRNFACPTLPPSSSFYKVLTPTAYGYQNLFKCDNLNDITKRRQLTCVDYAKFGEEFGGSNGLAKRSRTFLGQKGGKFYWIVADGCLDQVTTAGGPARCKGFTIEELGDMAKSWGLETLLNLDGGSSSCFFVNGRGTLQFIYDQDNDPKKLQIGPQGQRLLQCVLMLVPKQRNLDAVVYKDIAKQPNNGFVRLTNGQGPVIEDAFVDLSSNIPEIKKNPSSMIAGKFALASVGASSTVPGPLQYKTGQILFSYVENSNAAFKNAVIAGIGPIPDGLKTALSGLKFPTTGGKIVPNFKSAIGENNFEAWSVVVRDSVIKAASWESYSRIGASDLRKRSVSALGESLNDGQIHTFLLAKGGTTELKTGFSFFIDHVLLTNSFDVDSELGLSNRDYKRNLFDQSATNFFIGSMVISGQQYSNQGTKTVLDVADWVFTSSLIRARLFYEDFASSRQNGQSIDPENILRDINSGLIKNNITSNLEDNAHNNDFDFVFPFDEPDDTKEITYSWVLNPAGISKSRKQTGQGTLVGNAFFTNEFKLSKTGVDKRYRAKSELLTYIQPKKKARLF